MDAFTWAADQNVPNAAKIISHSATAHGDSEFMLDTSAGAEPSLNVDWLVHSTGACFAQAAGNISVGFDGLAAPGGALNAFVVGGYDDGNDPNRASNTIWTGTCPGPTSDPDNGRRKPDVCAPAVGIRSTDHLGGFTTGDDGTSFATPHVAGACAILLEARSSLTPQQIHAILVASADFAPIDPENGNNPQTGWHIRAGWGMLNAYQAVGLRNQIVDDQVSSDPNTKTYYLTRPSAGAHIVAALAWHREMDDETTESYAPADLNLYLDRRSVGGLIWSQVAASESSIDRETVEVLWSDQGAPGHTQCDFRVRVVRASTGDPSELGFTLCVRPGL
jgi:subtilisin family serine protease